MLKVYWINLKQFWRCLVFLTMIFYCLSMHNCRPSQASSIQALTLGQLTRLSALVFEGQVTAREVFEDEKGRIWTRYRVEIKELWKGKETRIGHNLEFSLLGGTLGEGILQRRQVVHGQVELKINQRGIFFLEKTAVAHYVFTGMSQGFFGIVQKDGQRWVKRHINEQHLYGKVSALRLGSDSYDSNFKPLHELKSLVTRGAKKTPSIHTGKHKVYLLETSSTTIAKPYRQVNQQEISGEE